MTETPLHIHKLRRNGKEQSCEPCRKAKLRCDHAIPCSRCTRKNKIAQCIYHPAPMTQVPAKAANSHARRTSLPCTNPMTFETGGTIGYSRKPPSYTLGYMGATGHSAIFLENKEHLDDVWDEAEIDASTMPEAVSTDEKAASFSNAILAWLPDQQTSEAALKRFFEQAVSIVSHEPTVMHFHRLFWSTYGHLLQEPRTEEKLSTLSEQLIRNSKVPFKVPASDEEFLDSFTGSHSRWSTVGWLFVTYSLLAATSADAGVLCSKPFPTDSERRNYACSMLECADACLMLSDELGPAGNILSLTLMFRNVVCQSVVVGDTSFDLWKRRGALISAVTAFGLHQGTVQTASTSRLFVEQQKRLFASVFAFDKTLATFLGRPPGLSRHYVTCELPLDVSDDELMQGGEALANGLASRNEDGWNTRGKLFPATIARAFLLSRYIRDEVLELSLGARPIELSARVHDVRARCEQMYWQIPEALRTCSKTRTTERSAIEHSIKISFQLDHLHNLFLLERIEHPEKDEVRFYDAARRMLDIIISEWSSRDDFASWKDSTHWMISCFGIPAASALAMELWYSTCDSTRSFVARGDVIQKLSIFVACLDSVRPSSGNHALCMKIRSLIKRILDKVLDPHEPRSTPTSQDLLIPEFPAYGMPVDGFQTFDIDFQAWMNGIDWTQAPGLP